MPILTTGAGAYAVAGGGGGGNAVTLIQVAAAFGAGIGSGGLVTEGDLTVTAGLPNPALIAVMTVANNVSATSIIAAWDSNAAGGAAQPMTLLINQDAGGGKQVVFFGLRNPRVGSWRLGMSWTGTVQYIIHAMVLSHVNPASDAAAFPGFVGTNAGGVPNSITVATGVNNFAVAGFSGDPGNVTAVSHTEWFQSHSGNSWSVAGCYGASSTSTMTLTETPGNATAVAAGGCIAHD